MRTPLNVTAVFDTQYILASTQDPSQNPEQPTPAPEDGAYLITAKANAVGLVGERRLVLSCEDADEDGEERAVAWRGRSLSGDADQSVILYRIEHLAGIRATGVARAISDQVPQPIPDSQSPTDYSIEPQYDYRLTTPIKAFGGQVRRLDFYIVDRQHSTLTTLGYFSWNATLVLVGRDGPIEPSET